MHLMASSSLVVVITSTLESMQDGGQHHRREADEAEYDSNGWGPPCGESCRLEEICREQRVHSEGR